MGGSLGNWRVIWRFTPPFIIALKRHQNFFSNLDKGSKKKNGDKFPKSEKSATLNEMMKMPRRGDAVIAYRHNRTSEQN